MHNQDKRPDLLFFGVVNSVVFDRKFGVSSPDRFRDGGGGQYLTARTLVTVPSSQGSLISSTV